MTARAIERLQITDRKVVYTCFYKNYYTHTTLYIILYIGLSCYFSASICNRVFCGYSLRGAQVSAVTDRNIELHLVLKTFQNPCFC